MNNHMDLTVIDAPKHGEVPYHVVGLPAFDDNYIWVILPRRLPELTVPRPLAVVDPGDAGPLLDYCQRHHAVPTHVLLTHHHADHMGGVAEIADWIALNYPGNTLQVLGPRSEEIPGVTDALDGGESRLLYPGVEVQVLALPGHTRGHLAYFIAGQEGRYPPSLFSGDVLFGLGCGRLFEGTALQMHEALSKIAALDEETHIYCAHEYTLLNLPFALAVDPDNRRLIERAVRIRALRQSGEPTVPLTLAEELATNPFLRADLPALASAACVADGASEVEVFASLRKMRDTFKAQR